MFEWQYVLIQCMESFMPTRRKSSLSTFRLQKRLPTWKQYVSLVWQDVYSSCAHSFNKKTARGQPANVLSKLSKTSSSTFYRSLILWFYIDRWFVTMLAATSCISLTERFFSYCWSNLTAHGIPLISVISVVYVYGLKSNERTADKPWYCWKTKMIVQLQSRHS